MSVLSSLKFLAQHPLTRASRGAALLRWFRWQVGSRLVGFPIAVPYVNDSKLLVQAGMTGATGNVYAGLHEFEDMGFVLHALRPTDLFLDVGANVGSYTVLAASAVGSRCISIEPVPSTFARLRHNIAINDMGARVAAYNIGLARAAGDLRFTAGLDTVNHVTSEGDDGSSTIAVPVRTLDELLDGAVPCLAKIDVEGFEAEVVAGGQRTFSDRRLWAVIMELNGSGGKYGFDEDELHQSMLSWGFRPCRYRPFERDLEALDQRQMTGNTLYVRNAEEIRVRLRAAPRFRLGIGGDI